LLLQTVHLTTARRTRALAHANRQLDRWHVRSLFIGEFDVTFLKDVCNWEVDGNLTVVVLPGLPFVGSLVLALMRTVRSSVLNMRAYFLHCLSVVLPSSVLPQQYLPATKHWREAAPRKQQKMQTLKSENMCRCGVWW